MDSAQQDEETTIGISASENYFKKRMALVQTQKLKKLNIRGIAEKKENFTALVEALKVNVSIQYLTLYGIDHLPIYLTLNRQPNWRQRM